jgi:hypothetical protein
MEMSYYFGVDNIMGQVSGYHPIKALDPEFVLPVLR